MNGKLFDMYNCDYKETGISNERSFEMKDKDLAKRTKDKFVPVNLESLILKFGLNSDPASANVVAKRLEMKETPKNITTIRQALTKLEREKKVYRSGNRYAIDFKGGINLMKKFCIKVSNDNYKIDNFVFDNISSN